jgi:hypothetical protein
LIEKYSKIGGMIEEMKSNLHLKGEFRGQLTKLVNEIREAVP